MKYLVSIGSTSWNFDFNILATHCSEEMYVFLSLILKVLLHLNAKLLKTFSKFKITCHLLILWTNIGSLIQRRQVYFNIDMSNIIFMLHNILCFLLYFFLVLLILRSEYMDTSHIWVIFWLFLVLKFSMFGHYAVYKFIVLKVEFPRFCNLKLSYWKVKPCEDEMHHDFCICCIFWEEEINFHNYI